MNQKGQVVGNPGPWLWSNGLLTNLPPGPKGPYTAAGIDHLGRVVGSFQTGEYGYNNWGEAYPLAHAFVWRDGSYEDLGTLGGESSGAFSINDQGTIVGYSAVENKARVPVLVQGDVMRSLQSLLVNPTGWELSLGLHYQASDGRIWGSGLYDSKTHMFEMVPEGTGTYRIRSRGIVTNASFLSFQVFGINEFGQAAGRMSTPTIEANGAFLWDEGGLRVLGYPGRNSSWAYGLNNFSQVVGMYYVANEFRAFLWEAGSMIDLNELIPADSGVLLMKASAINDAGRIVCSFLDSTTRAYGVCLLIPTNPVPLRISRHGLTPAGLKLEVTGAAGEPLEVEYTTDWSRWETLAASTNFFGRRTFLDAGFGADPFRAYRAKVISQ